MNLFCILLLIFSVHIASSDVYEEIKLKQVKLVFYKLGDICKIVKKVMENFHDLPSQTNYYVTLYEPDNFNSYEASEAADKIFVSPHFNKSAKTIIFLQGFRPQPIFREALEMEKEFERVGKFNFLTSYYKTNMEMTDYEDYLKLTTLTKHFGRQMADFLGKIIKKGVDDLYLIGYSFGAPIIAHAARVLKKEHQLILPRITALDPIAICFVNGLLDPLDYRDATFVDIIHTSYLSYTGSFKGRGHADFFVNSRLGNLPECESSDIACMHIKVLDYYIKSINNYTEFLATQCLNYECTSISTSYMGFRADPTAKGTYYVKTG